MPRYFIKDPDSTLDYRVDWSRWLGEDTISSSSWTADSGVTVDSSSNTNTVATVFVSGGTVGERYKLVNRVDTANGKTEDRTIYLKIEER